MIRQKIKSRSADVFLDLVKSFPLRPIRTEADHQAASRILRRLVGSKSESDFKAGERDYMESLAILVRDYQHQNRRRQLAALRPVEILRHLMEENAMNVTELGNVIGSRTAASMILHGQRHPSKAHILRLADRFRVDPALFMGEWSKTK